MLILSRITGWVIRHKRRIQTIGTGLFLYETFNLVYNYGFYLFALSYWGIVEGGILAAGLSFIVNAGVFWAYDHMKVDWLGAYALRELDSRENKNLFERLATWIGKADKTSREKVLAGMTFILMLIRVDPVVVAIHFQHEHFKGLKVYDWFILLTATTVGNVWWLIQTGLFVEAVRYVVIHFFN